MTRPIAAAIVLLVLAEAYAIARLDRDDVLLVAGIALAAALVAAAPASAHQADPNFLSRVDAVTPSTRGVTVDVVNRDDSLLLINDSGRDVVVYGYNDDPYARIAADGTVAVKSPPKEVREFDGVRYVLERAIAPDYALVHAWKGDRHGNLVYRRTARNFNPDCAAAGRITIAQVEHLVEPGEIDPDAVHTPGIHVQRVVHVPDAEKPVEFRTVRK